MSLRVVHVSQSDGAGGAARAAWRLHRALVEQGIDSRMLVVDRQGADERVLVHRPASRLHRVLRRWVRPRAWRVDDERAALHRMAYSINVVPSGIVRAAERLGADIVHLHWIGRETASIAEIARASRPLLWTLHDMWAFAGALHYEADASASLWRCGVTSLREGPGADRLDRWTWLRKARHWRRLPIEFVAPSRWLAQLLAASTLFRDRPSTVIPHALDLAQFRPLDSTLARQRLGLPTDRPILCFGAQGGLQDPRKGGDVLFEALRRLPEELLKQRPLLCVFGQARPRAAPELPLDVAWLGEIHDDEMLALIYSATDVMVVPSKAEAFGQTGSEAQACGRPVVAFAAGGLADVIDDRRTGYLATPGSADSLAEGIVWALDPGRAAGLAAASRQRAQALWSGSVVAGAYRTLYERIAGSRA